MAKDDLDENPPNGLEEAYKDIDFLESDNGRALRMLAEYMEPNTRFSEMGVSDTIVVFGSARIPSPEQAQDSLKKANAGDGDLAMAQRDVKNARYYTAARTLSRRLTEWARNVDGPQARFVICSGGGPGIMEAANRGAADAGGINIGLNIRLPHEQHENPYVTDELSFKFHYFFMRKFWFVYLAKAVIIFPGGFGTMDELFEVLTLDQTGKLAHPLPIVLFGSEYWNDVVNLDAMVTAGTIDANDLALCLRTDSIDEAYDFLVRELSERALPCPGGNL